MKTKLLLIALFYTTCVFSQSGINYKAVIKDGSGNIVANSFVGLQFEIIETSATGTVIYSESHAPTTDANGQVILIIGDGNPISGTFSTIDWGTDDHFLNVQVSIGAGLVDMGTTQFMSVPYALNAAKASIAENVNGLEAVDEGSGLGHRIIGRNLNNLGDIGLNAVDLSGSPIASTTYGATGEYSVAMNRQTTAQGDFSTAMGLDSKAYGATSTVMGFNTIANGFDAVAMGAYTMADASQSLAIGRYNVGGGNNEFWNTNDPIFEIGIGTGNTLRSNALTVLKNGTITAPSLTNALIDAAGNKSLIQKEYLDNRVSSLSLDDLMDAKTVSPSDVFIGQNAGLQNASGNLGSVGMGLDALRNQTAGFGNSAFGFSALRDNTTGPNNTAIGANALRENTTTAGNTAVGSAALLNNNLGNENTAIGYNALVSNTGSWNTVVGASAGGSITSACCNTAVGRRALLNSTIGSSNVAIGLDALSSVTSGNNNIGIGNGAQVPNPIGAGQVRIGNSSINYAGIQVPWTITSDMRWKDNIRDLPFGLDMVSELRPVDYVRKNNQQQTREAGFIAQEVRETLKNLNYHDQGMLTEADDGYLSLRYNDLIPVLVKAIQEQQNIINIQKTKLEKQGSEIAILSEEINQIQQLTQRIKQLEAKQNQIEK